MSQLAKLVQEALWGDSLMAGSAFSEKVKQKMTKELIQLLIQYPFFGYLALGLELKETVGIPTLATDGYHLYYNPFFVGQLDSKMLRAVIAHETLHCALGHLWRRDKRKEKKWNYAADYAVNSLLKEEGFTLPDGCLYDKRYNQLSAEKIYGQLGDSVKGELMDSHDCWTKHPGGETESGDDFSDKKYDRIWQDRLARAATGAKLQGKLSKNIEKYIKERLRPKLDWRIILHDLIIALVKNDFTLIPPAKKHLWRNIYLPSLRTEALEIAVAVDTSGSIDKKTFVKFIAEIKGITEQFNDYVLHLFFADNDVHSYLTLQPCDPWPKTFPKKGGGTNFIPVFNAVESENLQIAALIYLTDGEGTYPVSAPAYPVIWVLSRDYNVPWGEKIHLGGK